VCGRLLTGTLIGSLLLLVALSGCSGEKLEPEPQGTLPPADVAAPPPDAATTSTGLAYRVLAKGPHSSRPARDARVLVNYTGWTTDGAIVAAAPIGTDPVTVDLGKTMAGWQEALSLMEPGDKFRVWIPPHLALAGEAGKPQGMLIYDIYLHRFSNQ
jgi:FKBP-type peptidyl-prolyl cis-trans isomerase